MTARPMSEELEPCPFCGGAVKVAHHKGSDETGERWDYFSVECRGKDHNVICDSGDTAEEIAAAWNRRSTSSAERGMREALRAAKTYLMDVSKDRSDAARGTLEIIEDALSGIEPGEDEQARGQGRSAPISTDTKGTTK